MDANKKKKKIAKLAKEIRNRIILFYLVIVSMNISAIYLVYQSIEAKYKDDITIVGSAFIMLIVSIFIIEAFITHRKDVIKKAFFTGTNVQNALFLSMSFSLLIVFIDLFVGGISMIYGYTVSAFLFGIAGVVPILGLLVNIAIIGNQIIYGIEDVTLMTELYGDTNTKKYWHTESVPYLCFKEENHLTIVTDMIKKSLQEKHERYMMSTRG